MIRIIETNGKEKEICVAIDGTWAENKVEFGVLERLLASAYWSDDFSLVLALRWIETCGVETLKINVNECGVIVDVSGTLALHDDQRGIEGQFYR